MTEASPIDSLLTRWQKSPSSDTHTQFRKAIQELDSVELSNIAPKLIRFSSLKVEVLARQAVLESQKGSYATALRQMQAALGLATQAKFWGSFCQLYNDMGFLHEKLGQYDSALIYQRKGLPFCEQENDSTRLAISRQNVGITYYRLGLPDSTLVYFVQSLNGYQALGDTVRLSSMYYNVATLLNRLGRYREAIPYYDQSLAIRQARADTAGLLNVYNGLAVCYKETADPDSALSYHQEALRVARAFDDPHLLGMTLNNIGNYLQAQGQYLSAIPYLQESLAIRRRLGRKFTTAQTLINLATALSALEQYKAAEQYLLEALDYASHLGQGQERQSLYQALVDVYRQKNEPEKALTYVDSLLSLQKFLYDASISEQITQTKIRYETVQKEQALLLQQERIQRLEESRRYEAQRSYALIAFLGMLLVFGGIFYQRQRTIYHTRQQLTDLELQQAKQALQAYTERLLEKSRLIQQLKSQTPPAPESPPTNENDPDIFAQLIASRILTPEDWQHYKTLFGHIYPRFLPDLYAKYPQLTEGEVRLIVLSKLELTHQETADMLGISTGAVKVARNRIRRKLELPKGSDLKNIL